jgi:hypothetical protein
MRALSLPVAAVLACLAVPARAQEPAGGPPPSSGREASGPYYHELLPDIGLIGAQVGLSAGPAWNPYDMGRGLQAAGFVDLPLVRAGGGKLSYEILIALSHGRSAPFVLTDTVAYVANLAAGASPDAARRGPPDAPFPVRRSVRSRLRVLEVSPFGLRYTLHRLDRARLRPYVAAGLDFTVVITREVPEADESLEFRGTAPFDDALIGGLIAQAPELGARGLPSGQGNIELGWHAAAGVEIRLARRLSLNAEYRFAAIGADGRLHALGTALGLHW